MSKLDKNLSDILDVDPIEKVSPEVEDEFIVKDISYKPSREFTPEEKGKIIKEYLKKEEKEKLEREAQGLPPKDPLFGIHKTNSVFEKAMLVSEVEEIEKKYEPEIQNLDHGEMTIAEKLDKNSIDAETEFARNNIKRLLKTGEMAMEQILHIANSSQHPRAYEVMSGLMKNMSELNKDLLGIQKIRKELSGEYTPTPNASINVDKAVVFSGTTSDLLKLLKSKKDGDDENT